VIPEYKGDLHDEDKKFVGHLYQLFEEYLGLME
jgi:hypothetical protein